MTRERSRLEALRLLNEASRVLIHMTDRPSNASALIAEISLCWKHVRDMDEHYKDPGVSCVGGATE
jgi:hypothetical protein